MKKFWPTDSNSSGNALFAVFGAVVLVGLVGASVTSFIKGPLTSTVKQTRMNVAKSQMQIAAQVGIMASAADNTNALGPYARVFVTNAATGAAGGNLGGLSGADTRCQNAATAAGLPGTYKAWLSDLTGSPSTRFTQLNMPYRRVDGVLLANSWADFTDGTLAANPDKTEIGTTLTGAAWTGTNADGTRNTVYPNYCNNWTDNTTGYPGTLGITNATSGLWSSQACCTACNNASMRVYCVQQEATATASNSGDCDNDGIIEPLEWTLASAGVSTPIGGGLIPSSIGISTKDPWGTPYGYCSWDYGSTRLASGCQQTTPSTNMRLSGSTTDNTTPVVAIISAGPDRTFSTTCRTYAAADVTSNGSLNDATDLALVGKTNSGDDDVIFTYTYDQAVAASGGLWSLKSGNQVVASTKNIEAQTAKFSGAGLFQSLAASVGTFVDAVSGLRLANPTQASLCDANNAYALRRNVTNDGIEICNGTTWVAIAGGSGGGGTAPVIDPVPITQNKVFATSLSYKGDLGGLSGADAKCQRLADKAGLGGKYMAWLADDSASPNTRFNKSNMPYKLVDGTTIANNWTDLLDGTLAAAITKNESGGAVPVGVWTNVNATTGNKVYAGNNGSCTSWSNGDPAVENGGWANTGVTTSAWSHTTRSDCSGSRGLLCFQQTEAQANMSTSGISAGAIDALTDSASDYTNTKLFIGSGSGVTAPASGLGHVGFGLGILNSMSNGDALTAFGYQAFPTVTGWSSTAFGAQSLGLATNEGNTAIGYRAMQTAPDNSLQNTAVGALALNPPSAQNNATVMGYQAGGNGSPTAFGWGALKNSNTDSANNVAVGYASSYSMTGGYYSTTVGKRAAYSNTLGFDLTVVGNNAYENSNVGDNNTGAAIIGNNAMAVATTTGTYVTMVGHNAGRYATGDENVGIGKDAIMGSVNGGLYGNGGANTAIGSQALKANTNGNENTAAGYGALMSNTTGSYNSAAGYLALSQAATASDNSAMGVFALYSLTTGDGNTAAGYQALKGLINGTANTAIGYNSGLGITATSNHTLIGSETQTVDVSGDGVTAIGYQALKRNTAGYNVAVGNLAGTVLASGTYNTIIGSQAYMTGTQGASNTIIGYKASANGAGVANTAVGANALLKGSGSNAAYGYNTAIGESALKSLTASGLSSPIVDAISYNTAVGYQALMNTTEGVNTVAGYQVMKNNTTGTANTAAGFESLLNNVGGSYNSALGGQTLYNNTYGSLNTAIGYQALYHNKGSYNTAIGYEALKGTSSALGGGANCSGLGAANVNDANTGRCYFRTSSTGVWNNAATACSAIDPAAYPAVVSSAAETALINPLLASPGGWIGASANGSSVIWQYGDMKNIPIAGANIDVSTYKNWHTEPSSGFASGCTYIATGSNNRWVYTDCTSTTNTTICERDPSTFEQSFNTALGYRALTANASGSYNTALGTRALVANTSGSYNTAIGYQALGNAALTTGSYNTAVGNGAGPNGDYSNTTSVGYGATTAASNSIRLGNASITAISGQVAITSPSDKRLKQDIEPSDLGLDFIMGLKPVSYRLKKGNGRLDYGFIAQDLEESLGGRITNMLIHRDDKMHTYEMRASDLQAPLIKALQEQEEIIEKLEHKIAQLKLARRLNYCHSGNPTGGRE